MNAMTIADGPQRVREQFKASIEAPPQFFEANADKVARVSYAMARRFHEGGRLLVFGSGSAATDAQHVAVEFVHPVIVGKRALPALALTTDLPTVLGLAQRSGLDHIFAQQLRLLGKPHDIALGLCNEGAAEAVERGLSAAREMGMLAIGMGGTNWAAANSNDEAGYHFSVQSEDSAVVQEVLETTYHILWETVHVFFEHHGLLEGLL